MNPRIDYKSLSKKIVNFCGKNGGWILARESENEIIEILGKSQKRLRNQQYSVMCQKNLNRAL